VNNPEKVLFSFQVDAASAPECTSCPDELTFVSNDAGQCSALLSFDAAASGFPAPSVTCTLNGTPITSPYDFPSGTNLVICTAVNPLGQATCSFTGKGGGRVYTITVEVSDRAGNKSQKSTTVTVPHDNGDKHDKGD
jgi:hypothetical protein